MNFKTFMNKHRVNDDNYNILGKDIFRGKFLIEDNEYKKFIKLYSNFIDNDGRADLMEVRHNKKSLLCIDLDFKRNGVYGKRLYEDKHIEIIVSELNKILCDVKTDYRQCIFEKDEATIKNDLIKDGLHIVCEGLVLSVDDRRYVIETLTKNLSNYDIFNSYLEHPLDKASINCNWFLFGSYKEDGFKYNLTSIFTRDNEEILITDNIETKDLVKIFSNTYKLPETTMIENKKIENKKIENKQTEDLKDNNKLMMPYLYDFINLIDVSYCNNYKDWLNVCLILHSNFNDNTHQYKKYFSSKVSGYNKQSNEHIFKGMKKKDVNNLTYKSLLYYCMNSNKNATIELMKKIGMIKDNKNIELDKWYQQQKNEYEKNHFIIINPKKRVVHLTDNNEIMMDSINDTKTASTNNFFKTFEDNKEKKHIFFNMWIDDPERRQYDYIDFNPLHNGCYDNTFNLFNGFKYHDENYKNSIMPEEFKIVFDYIFNNDTSYIYSWIKHIITKPHLKTGKCIVLYSHKHGVGKNSIQTLISKIIGYDGKLEEIDDLTRKFNSHLSNKLFIYGDEIKARKLELVDLLKNSITKETINIERKGIDVDGCKKDYSNYFFTTNNEKPFRIEKEDRRFYAVEINNNEKLDKNVWEKFRKSLNDDEKIKQIFNYFYYNEDIEILDITTSPPSTEYKMRLQIDSYEGFMHFIYNEFVLMFDDNDNKIDNNFYRYSINDFKELSTNYSIKHKLTSNHSTTYINKKLEELQITKYPYYGKWCYKIPSNLQDILIKYDPQMAESYGL